MTRRHKAFIYAMIVFYFGNMLGLILGSRYGFLNTLIRYEIEPLGIIAIVIGLRLIFKLTRQIERG